MDSTETDYQNLLAEYEGAVNAYGSAVRALIAARGSSVAKGSARFKSAMDAVNVAHRKCEDLHTRLGDARKKAVNMSEPTELDETEQLLHAEFYECARELAVAKEKLNNPRQSLVYHEYMNLRKEVDAIQERCDQIRVKIREHKKVKRWYDLNPARGGGGRTIGSG